MERRSEEHTSELQSHLNLVCRLLLEKKTTTHIALHTHKHTSAHTHVRRALHTQQHTRTYTHTHTLTHTHTHTHTRSYFFINTEAPRDPHTLPHPGVFLI